MIVIVMGVTASGKTTVAAELVKLTGWKFAEGDDYHSEANKQKMHTGQPLNDADRVPWLAALHEVIAKWASTEQNGIMTCSALKQSYRDILTANISPGLCRFVLLEVPFPILEKRVKARPGHFMNPGLLQSQLDTLELPHDAIRIDATKPPAEVARNILSHLALS